MTRTLALGGVFALLLAGCGGAEARNQATNTDPVAVPEAPGTRVEVATIHPSDALLELIIPGEVEGASDATLASPAGGYIESVLVTEGQEVRSGQSLVRVNSAIYAAQSEQAQAQHDQAKIDMTRLEAIGSLASPAQLDRQRTQLRVTKASADLARVNLSRSVIRAPFAGVIGQLGAKKGEIANPGAPLVRVVQLDPVHISASVSDRDVVAMRVGMDASVTTEAVPDLFKGHILHIDPAASLQTRSFTVEVEVPNPDRRLLPGMIASVRVYETLAADSVIIPQDWLVTRIDSIGVFVDDEGVAAWRTVTSGAVVHDQIVISSGLSVSDRVVMNGHRGLAEGDKLIVTREGECCESGRATFAAIK
ncbi:MAG: membrane fusion protein (multidrug efflux system) [Myxococcota bacterium]|jgi:membrane fusion protein (multidrug efflux system)